MNGRKNRRKRSFKRVMVTMLTFVMLISVCFPGMMASAEEVVTEPTESQAAAEVTVFDTLMKKIEEAKANTALTADDLALLGQEISTAYQAEEINAAQYEALTLAYNELTVAPVDNEGGEDVNYSESSEESSSESVDESSSESVEESSSESVEESSSASAEETTTEPSETSEPEETTTAPSESEEPSEPSETTEAAQDPAITELYNNLMACQTYAEMEAMLEELTADQIAQFTDEQYSNIQNHMNALYEEAYEEENDAEVLARPDDNQSTEGTFNHIEIEVAAQATVKIDGVPYTEDLEISTSDTFTITAKQGDKVHVLGSDFTYTGATNGNGSVNGATVELTGSYPSGTQSDPVYYTISVTRNVTFYKRDESGNMLDANGNVTTNTSDAVVVATLPITLTVTVNYWMSDNYCPGICSTKTENGVTTYTWNENWQKGYFQGGAGIDYPIHGDAGNLIITKGKLMITKSIVNDTTDTNSFDFYLQNSAGQYVVFSNGAYSNLSDTLVDGCYVTVAAGSAITLTDLPMGGYKVTEVQKDGYIIANVNGTDTSTNYSTDFIEVTKEDTSIPVAAFKNKKLTEEAGISIKKVASGLSGNETYPNPTVSIYAYADGTKTGDALWSGTLTANGDTLYLTTTLPEGTYIIEETGYEVSGYSCATTISGGATVNGMIFTVVKGNRYDLTVINNYAELPKTTSITLDKNVTGNMGDWNKKFTFTVYVNDVPLESTYNLTHQTPVVTIPNIPIGATVKIEESDNESYSVSATLDGKEVEVNNSAIEFTVTSADGHSVVFTNDLNASIDTGITTNTFPMILLFSTVTVLGAVLLIGKKRYEF